MTRSLGFLSGGHPQKTHRRFGRLLILLVATYLLSAFASGDWVKVLQLALFCVTAYLALQSAPFRRNLVRLILTGALAGSVIMIAVLELLPGNDARAAASIWVAGVLLLTVALIVWQVISAQTVTAQSIYGAFSAYLLIGFLFSSLYSSMYYLHGGAFFSQPGTPTMPTFQYFSFTTLTTLGYGDFTAATNGGRALAMIEAITGQIFLATLVARLVATYHPARGNHSGTDPR